LVDAVLLLAGQRLPLSQPLPPRDNYAMLCRSDKRPDCEVFAWTLRQPLPILPIPLGAPDADVLVDLGAVFEAAYARGRYARSLPYGKPPRAPMKREDRRWSTERSEGK